MSIATGMIPNTLSPAVVAAMKMTSQIGGAAVNEVRYDSVLIRREGI
jgi:hypothetical protein